MSVPNQRKYKNNKAPWGKQASGTTIPFTPFNREAFDLALSTLSPAGFKLWCYIARNQQGYEFEFSREAAINATGLSLSTIQRARSELEQQGYLVLKGGNSWNFFENPGAQGNGSQFTSKNSQKIACIQNEPLVVQIESSCIQNEYTGVFNLNREIKTNKNNYNNNYKNNYACGVGGQDNDETSMPDSVDDLNQKPHFANYQEYLETQKQNQQELAHLFDIMNGKEKET